MGDDSLGDTGAAFYQSLPISGCSYCILALSIPSLGAVTNTWLVCCPKPARFLFQSCSTWSQGPPGQLQPSCAMGRLQSERDEGSALHNPHFGHWGKGWSSKEHLKAVPCAVNVYLTVCCPCWMSLALSRAGQKWKKFVSCASRLEVGSGGLRAGKNPPELRVKRCGSPPWGRFNALELADLQ